MQNDLIPKSVTWFFSELNSRNINYAVLRKVELIPDNIGNDIDILVAPADEKKLKEVVFACAMEFGFKIYERQDTKGHYPILYKFEPVSNAVSRTELRSGAGVNGPSDANALAGKQMSHVIFLRLDFTNPVKDPDALLEKRMQNEKGIYFLSEGVYTKPKKSKFKNLLTYPWRFFFPPGKFIVIVGPDGVGKSTTAELVTELLVAFHVPVRHMHLGFRPQILPTKKGFVSFGKERPVAGEKSNVPGPLRFLYHSLDHFLGFWCVVRPALVGGKTIIGERYYYSHLVDPRPRKRYGVPMWAFRIAFFFMPKPDLVILLSHAPEAIYKRRQEHSIEEIGRQIVEYRAWGMRAKRFFEVGTEKSPADVATEVACHLAPKRYKLAIVASHPIQYQSPLWREIARHPDINATVYYSVDWGVTRPQSHKDFFSTPYKWDIPLLNGYQFKFLRNYSPKPGPYLGGFINPGIFWELWKNRYDAVLVMGWMDVTFWFAFLAGKLTHTPVFLRVVNSNYYDTHVKRSDILLFLKRIYLKTLFRWFVSGFLAIGTWNRKMYLDYDVPERRIFHFPYAVWNEFFMNESEKCALSREEIRREYGISHRAKVVAFAARFTEVKHPEHAIRAFEKIRDLSDAVLLMVGDGEMRAALEKEVAERHIKNVRFLGFKNQRELVRIYAITDVFIRTDAPIKGDWGATTNEAMACGLPIISSDTLGSQADLVRSGENGFVFPFGDIDALVGYLRKLLLNEDMLVSMKKKSKEIISRWSYNEDVAGLLDALQYIQNRK